MHKLFFSNLIPGTKLFSKFELLECISAGDSGAVYRCSSIDDQKEEIALKVFSTESFKRDPNCKNLQQEVQVAFNIKHPNVVQCMDFFSDDCFTAFSMEFVSGGTLGDYLEKNKPLVICDVLRILRQLAAGLNAIHQAGIVHRDIKPENILIDSRQNVKVTDFGIASIECSARDDVGENICGTVNYLAPEYIARGEYDARTDIYAFGVVAYELLTGRMPFTGGGILDTLISRVRFDPVHPKALRAEIPRSLGDVAMKAMQRDPSKRYQSSDEIVSALDMIEGLDVQVGSVRAKAFENLIPLLSRERRTARAA